MKDCRNITPPAVKNKRFHREIMDTEYKPYQLTIVSKKEEGLAGVLTTDMGDCISLIAVIRSAEGEIKKLAMRHCAGGVDDEKLHEFSADLHDAGIDDLSQVELIYWGGSCYARDKMADNSIYKQSSKVHLTSFKQVYYGVGSRCCVTFDGYFGAMGYNILGKTKAGECCISGEKGKEERLFEVFYQHQNAFNLPEEKLKDIATCIKKDSCGEETKETLFYLTREFILEAKLSNNGEKRRLFHNYQQAIKNLPIMSATRKALLVFLSLTIVGLVISGPLLAYSLFSQQQNRDSILKSTQNSVAEKNDDTSSSDNEDDKTPFVKKS